MRIIAGNLKGRKLLRSKNLTTRPTTDRVRESLYALVEARISLQGVRLLDLFSGTGALAFEGISRGAEYATLIDFDHKAVRVARNNAESLNLLQKCNFLCADAMTYLQQYHGPPLDLILADPPYELNAIMDLPNFAIPHLCPGGMLVVEHDLRTEFSKHPNLDTSRGYGRTHVSIFQV